MVALAGLLGLAQRSEARSLDRFARCLDSRGAVYYGATWCPQCRRQDALFGSSLRYVPRVECADAETGETTRTCRAANVKAFPTWTLRNGERLRGRQSLERLAAVTGCTLP